MLIKRLHQDQPIPAKPAGYQPHPIRNRSIALIGIALGCCMPIGWIQLQKTILREQSANVEQLLKTNPVEGLVLAIQTLGQNRDRLPWSMQPEVEASLLDAVQMARERNRLEQQNPVYTVAVTPNGQKIATAGKGGNIYLWDQQGHQTQVLEGDGQEIGAIHFSPDGMAVFGDPADDTGIVHFWNVNHTAPYQPLPNQNSLTSASFSSNGEMVISGSTGGRMRLWNPQGEAIANLYPRLTSGITAVAFDGPSIASSGEDGNITLWDNKGNLLGQLWAGAKIQTMRLSQGGQRIIIQDLKHQQAFLWNSQTHRWNQFVLGDTPASRSADLSLGNTVIARGNPDGTVNLLPLNPQNNRFPPQSFLGHQGAVNTVLFSPDGKTVISGGEDGSTRLWDLWDGTLITQYHLQEWISEPLRTAALNNNGQQIAISNANGKITLKDIHQNPIAQFQNSSQQKPDRLVFSADGQTLAIQTASPTTGQTASHISLWHANGTAISAFPLSESIRHMALSPDGQRVISLSQSGTLQLWNAQGKVLSQPIAVDSSTRFVLFGPNGQQLISGGYRANSPNGQICLWQVQSDRLSQSRCHPIASQTAAFSPDGQTIAIGTPKGTLALWNPQTDQLQSTAQLHRTSITSITFSASGDTIASGSADGLIRLSNRQGQAIGQPFAGHQTAIQSLAFGSDDRNLVSLSWDGEVRVWQTSWQGWLKTACHRLQDHPIFSRPESSAAKAICERYGGWGTPEPSASTSSTTAHPTPPPAAQETRLVVKLGDRRVYVYQGASLQASYPIAIGQAGWETPVGTFHVSEMLQNPAWTHPITREPMEPGMDNPLGSRWIGFWNDGYNKIGFHGTPDRNSVGAAVSHGCLRMLDEDAQALYNVVQLGTSVTVEP